MFNNVVSVRLSDAACRGFSRTRNGVDWGWFPDPWRFVRCGSGEDAYLHDELIWCDVTPDGKQSMAVWRREAGLRVRPARK